MPDDRAPGPAAWLAEEWAKQLIRVMESMTGETPSTKYVPHELAPEETQPGEDGWFWWEQPFSLRPDALAWIGASTHSWQEVGNQVLKSAGVDDQDRESVRSTYLEIVRQALSGIAGALGARARHEVICADGRESPPAADTDLAIYSFEVTIGETVLVVLGAFTKSLWETSEELAQPHPDETAGATKPATEAAPTNPIDLLLDVELPVSVSFGRAQLALKDVIKLTTGSIVELNRAISEPVEVIVNNCVIARGEVVVVEGNFGIRIQQVISRQERLRTLN
jgi:flagellar motor switch protein FliN/FliY